MRRGVRFLFLTIVLVSSVVGQLFGQVDSVANKKAVTDCEASLSVANGEFNAGRFFSLPSILKGCLENGFTKEQKVRAYILLCQVYLINDEPAEAEASYLKLLVADPEYIATPELDPIDVVYLSKKFTTRPVFTPHFKVGTNTTFISLIHEPSTNGEPDSVKSSFVPKPGISLGGGLDWNMSDRISMSADVIFSTRKFSKSARGFFGNDRNDQTVTLSWIDLPFYLKYQDYEGKFRPYGYAGYGLHVKLGASAEYTYVNKERPSTEGGFGTETPTEGSVEKISDKQFLLNQSIVFGGGMKYKIDKNYLFVDLRILLGLSNVTNTATIYSSGKTYPDPNSLKYNVVNDLYRVNSINLTLGYIFPVYNPRKIGGWRPKGIIGKILYGNAATTDNSQEK
jgi:Outer membrane protein beta-barrel domain